MDLFLFKNWAIGLCFLVLLNSCTKPNAEFELKNNYNDVSTIIQDTIAYTNPSLTYVNGEYLLENEPYSGIVFEVIKGFQVESYSSVKNGQLHGKYISFYASGKPYEIREYSNGLSVGEHLGYWENSGNLKFEYHYDLEKKEGSQKNWYSDGSTAYNYTYKDDHLDGLQQAWRENGSLYRNFVVKNGMNYGLQRSKTCYEVSDEQVILQANKIEIK